MDAIDVDGELEAIEMPQEEEDLQGDIGMEEHSDGNNIQLDANDESHDDGLIQVERKTKDPAPIWSCGGQKMEGEQSAHCVERFSKVTMETWHTGSNILTTFLHSLTDQGQFTNIAPPVPSQTIS